MLQAKASGANVIGFASAGHDAVNGVKQAHEFGLANTMMMAAMGANPNDVDATGPELAQGLFLTSTFYRNMNKGTRAFTKRVLTHMPQKHPPNMIQAGCYGGTLLYLKTVAATGVAKAKEDGAAKIAAMKAMPTMDDAFGPGTIRIDGRALFQAYLLQAKAPGDIRGRWDLLKIVATTPADQAWRPLSEGGCSLVRA